VLVNCMCAPNNSMSKLISIIFLLLCDCAAGLNAQVPPNFTPPDGTVGVPYFFAADFGLIQALRDCAAQASAGETCTFDVSTKGTLPPGLSVDSNAAVSGTPTTAGDYSFTVNTHYVISVPGFTFQGDIPLPLFIHITDTAGPPISLSVGSLNFPLLQGAAAAPQPIAIANRSSVAQTFTASATTQAGGNWLSVSPTSGTIGPFSSGSVMAIVDPSALAPGTYTGAITMTTTPSGQRIDISVVVTVGSSQQQIQLASSGFRFQTVSGGAAPPVQSITVLNNGSGALNFTVNTSTVSGGQGWLVASPTSGRADSSSPATVTVSINPAGLAPGDYYGQVQFSSAGISNSPQTASVVLNIAPAGTDLGAFLQTTGLIFVGRAGDANPAAKTVQVTNPSNKPLIFNSITSSENGKSFFTVQPTSGSVSAATPVQLSVQANITGLAVGAYRGELTLLFDDRSIRKIAVLLVVIPAGSSAGLESGTAATPQAAGCTPTKLLPVFTQLGSSFAVVAAWPTLIEITVVDDCGTPMTNGNVVASFSSGDPPLSLASLKDGRWSATWQPRSSSTQVTVTGKAQQVSPALEGTQVIGGSSQANPTTPSFGAGGIVSAARSTGNQPLAPGSFISIYGTHLSSAIGIASVLPFTTQLSSTQVILGGKKLPLQYVSDGQINAVVPYDVPANSTQQIIVINGTAVSVPEPVLIAPAQPAVFAVTKPDTSNVDTSNPARANEVLVIYAAGLGEVNPPVSAGSAAVLSMTVNPVTVTFGGQQAVVDFAGLAPGFAGLYQVNARVPSGLTPANDVPLQLAVAGQQSTPFPNSCPLASVARTLGVCGVETRLDLL
jgi:uncharacterized protein (TIGR03437 family)